jgi:hypothetical protein
MSSWMNEGGMVMGGEPQIIRMRLK